MQVNFSDLYLNLRIQNGNWPSFCWMLKSLMFAKLSSGVWSIIERRSCNFMSMLVMQIDACHLWLLELGIKYTVIYFRRGIGWHLLKASEELISNMSSTKNVYLHCRMIDSAPFSMYKKAGYAVVTTDNFLVLLKLQRRKHLMCKELPTLSKPLETVIARDEEVAPSLMDGRESEPLLVDEVIIVSYSFALGNGTLSNEPNYPIVLSFLSQIHHHIGTYVCVCIYWSLCN